MVGMRIISADTDVVEPDGLWIQRLDAKLRDKAPRVVPVADIPDAVTRKIVGGNAAILYGFPMT